MQPHDKKGKKREKKIGAGAPRPIEIRPQGRRGSGFSFTGCASGGAARGLRPSQAYFEEIVPRETLKEGLYG